MLAVAWRPGILNGIQHGLSDDRKTLLISSRLCHSPRTSLVQQSQHRPLYLPFNGHPQGSLPGIRRVYTLAWTSRGFTKGMRDRPVGIISKGLYDNRQSKTHWRMCSDELVDLVSNLLQMIPDHLLSSVPLLFRGFPMARYVCQRQTVDHGTAIGKHPANIEHGSEGQNTLGQTVLTSDKRILPALSQSSGDCQTPRDPRSDNQNGQLWRRAK